jgi:hypothetical protein
MRRTSTKSKFWKKSSKSIYQFQFRARFVGKILKNPHTWTLFTHRPTVPTTAKIFTFTEESSVFCKTDLCEQRKAFLTFRLKAQDE